MKMEVKYGLPRVCAAAVEEIDAVGTEFFGCRLSDSLRGHADCGQIAGRDLEEILAVLLWDDQDVSVGSGVDVHESVRRVIFGHLDAGDAASDDFAEQTLIGHDQKVVDLVG